MIPQVQLVDDLSRPSYGRSVAGRAAPLAQILRLASSEIEFALPRGFSLEWIADTQVQDRVRDMPLRHRSAWALVALALMESASTGREPSISRSLVWFGDPISAQLIGNLSLEVAEGAISSVAKTEGIESLYPYVLDLFGPTSRLDVIRDETREADRHARKKVGSFYTPSDVADFMVSTISDDIANNFWFDPACGSGVFLLAALKTAALENPSPDFIVRFVTHNLHGVDISQQSADFTAFSLCNAITRRVPYKSLLPIWVSIRRNVLAIDALSIEARESGREAVTLEGLFGPINRPVRMLCNPPYVSNSSASGLTAYSAPYLSFTELAWKICTRTTDKASLVLPLSVVANRASDHCRFRSELVKNGGSWTMLSFDRQPHALFGEDAKTRATIVVRRHSKQFELFTSGLLKWTSKQRATIFTEQRAVKLDGVSISRFVPKLGGNEEACFYKALTTYRMRSPKRPVIGSIAPSFVAKEASDLTLFIGGTAYNYINVFRNYPPPPRLVGSLSSSRVHHLAFQSSEGACVGFALLSSLTAFWLWHVEADGFHVTSRFIDELPLFDLQFSVSQTDELALLGKQLWEEAARNTLPSNNGGKWTYAFRPEFNSVARRRVDELIIKGVGFDSLHGGVAAGLQSSSDVNRRKRPNTSCIGTRQHSTAQKVMTK